MLIKIDEESKFLLTKYSKQLQAEMQFKVSLEQAINRLVKITLGGKDGNTD